MARLDLPKPGGRLDGPDAAPAQTTPGAPAPNAAAAPPLERISNMASIGQIPANAGPPGLRQAALAGDPVAVYELASRAAEGRGAPRDLALAARLYEKAAGHGLVPAQYRTGNLYEKGLGVSRDLVIAKSWYQRAADKGNARAMHNLAVLIAEGVGGKPDYGSAIGWFRRAAQYGVRDSQFNLAVLLARGLGTQQDLSGSYMWFAVVASQGDEDAGKKRDEVAARLSPSELAAAKLTAERWRPDTPDKAVNEVALPAQGWAESPPPAKRPGSNNGKV
jgi:localization factor PodJL